MASQRDLDATISALQGGVTSLSPGAAVKMIDSWIGILHGAGFAPIEVSLAALRGELTSGQFSGARIGPLLTQLGRQTEEAASDAEPGRAGKLQHLASLLSHAGGAIMSFRPHEQEQVNALNA